MSYFTHLECPNCKRFFSNHSLQTYCLECNSPLLAVYDLAKAKQSIDRDQITQRPAGMWRWYELLPVNDKAHLSSLGEGDTPLLSISNLYSNQKSNRVFVKDECLNPTGSFKARGLSAAVSKAKELGINKLAIPTAGNAGSALAAYTSRAGLQSATVMPADTPQPIINECRHYGTQVTLVDGLISDAARLVGEMTASGDWFSVSTFKEPYRLEGKKTIGFELAEHFDWRLPDYILYPTGGGTGLVGMWKAFRELQELGWLESQQLPRMIAIQSSGCAPVVDAFESGSDHCEFWQDARTIASGIRVPISLADRLILKILKESGGSAVAVPDASILEAQRILARHAGIFSSPEGAATFAALNQMLASGSIEAEASVVLFVTASGVKYLPS